MKRILSLFFMIFCLHPSLAQTMEYKLLSISPAEFQQVVPIIQHVIEAEDNKTEILPFDISQTFTLVKAGTKIGYLVPVKYNSKIYKNTICRLYFLGLDKHFSQTELFAEKNDGDDIVPSCVGVESISTQVTSNSKLFYLAVIRQRLINNYSSVGKVIGYKNRQLLDEAVLNKCVRNAGTSSNIKNLREKVFLCQKAIRK